MKSDASATAEDLEQAKVPLILGVVGKISLFEPKNHEAAKVIAAALKDYLLDTATRYPKAPKLILSALAPGADHIAVWAALRANDELSRSHPDVRGFRIVAPLPLERETYEQDFGKSFQDYLEPFRALISPKGDTICAEAWWSDSSDDNVVGSASDLEVFSLPLLCGVQKDEVERDPTTGVSETFRSLHYEQSGLWIADRCQVLISIADPLAEGDLIGGAHRTRAAKRDGRLPDGGVTRQGMTLDALIDQLEARVPTDRPIDPDVPSLDPVGMRFRRLSKVLQQAKPLALVDEGIVLDLWHKDGRAIWSGEGREKAAKIFTWINRYDAEVERCPKKLIDAGRIKSDDWLRSGQPISQDDKTWLQDDAAIGRLAAVRLADIEKANAESPPPPLNGDDVFGERLVRMRRVLADVQPRVQARYNLAARLLAGLFVVSVVAFALYAKLYAKTGTEATVALSVYVLMIAIASLIVAAADHVELGDRRWAYRAIVEALRVQLAWRMGGISEGVDRHYARGSESLQGQVRTVIRSINATAEIAAIAATGKVDAASRQMLEQPESVERNWFIDQMIYFRKRHALRERETHRRKEAVVAIFTAAIGLAIVLLAAHVLYAFGSPLGKSLIKGIEEVETFTHPGFVGIVAILALAFVLAIGTWWWHRRPRPGDLRPPASAARNPEGRTDADAAPQQLVPSLGKLHHHVAKRASWIAPRLILGFVGFVAFALMAAAVPAFGLTAGLGVAIAIALLAALAGALNYVLEKSAIEVEAANYKEMLPLCRDFHAMYLASGTTAERRAVLHRFGMLSLEENVAWLRAHRERPLEVPPPG